GLERIAGEMTKTREGIIEFAIRRLERSARIHEARCAVPRRDIGERDAFDAQCAVSLGERRHRVSPLSVGASEPGVVSGDFGGSVVGGTAPGGNPVGAGAVAPGGSFNGPLMPQLASTNAPAQMIMAAMKRNDIGTMCKT